jgi:hypothetical protein
MSFQGYKMGNIAKTFTGSKAASGPYKRGIQAIVGQITDKNIFEILGQKITINPEEALTVLARKEAIEAYAKKNDIDSSLLDSLQKREAIGEHVANLYSRYIDDKDLNYLLSAFKHSPDAINSMAQSLVAHSALSGKYSQEIIADIITQPSDDPTGEALMCGEWKTKLRYSKNNPPQYFKNSRILKLKKSSLRKPLNRSMI